MSSRTTRRNNKLLMTRSLSNPSPKDVYLPRRKTKSATSATSANTKGKGKGKGRVPKTKAPNAAYNFIKVDPTFGIFSIFHSYRINLAHTLVRATLQPFFPKDQIIIKDKKIEPKLRKLCGEVNKSQLYLQTYCLQQIVFAEMAQHILSMVMDALQKKAKPMNGQKHEMFMEAFRAIQTGGGDKKIDTAIKKPLVFLLLLFYCITATSGNTGNPYELQTVNPTFTIISPSGPFPLFKTGPSEIELITRQLSQAESITSAPLNVNKAIEQYDEKIDEQISGTIGSMLYYLVHQVPSYGEESIIQYVEEFNAEMFKLSKTATNECEKIVKDAYTYGMFDNYKSSDQIEQLKEESEILTKKQKEHEEDTHKSIWETAESIMGTVVSAGVSWYTGDFSHIAGPAANTVLKSEDTASKMRSAPPKKIEDTTSNVNKEHGRTAKDLLKLSTVYCLNSFKLALDYSKDEKTLQLVGDKISYENMIYFTNGVRENMNLIQKMSTVPKDSESVFKSMEEKMQTIEDIVVHMEKMMTSGIAGELRFNLKARNADPINEIRSHFNEQKQKLDAVISTMGEMFPVTARKQRQELLTKEELSKLAANKTSETTRINTEYFTNVINSLGSLVKQTSYATMYNILGIPEGGLNAIFDKSNEIMYSILRKLMSSPTAMVITLYLSAILFFWCKISNGPVSMIGKIFYIPIGLFKWVFKWDEASGEVESVGQISNTGDAIPQAIPLLDNYHQGRRSPNHQERRSPSEKENIVSYQPTMPSAPPAYLLEYDLSNRSTRQEQHLYPEDTTPRAPHADSGLFTHNNPGSSRGQKPKLSSAASRMISELRRRSKLE